MLNQGNNMSYYGRSEYFRHLRIERLDGDVTPVFSDYLNYWEYRDYLNKLLKASYNAYNKLRMRFQWEAYKADMY